MNHICTWFCADDEGEESIFPQSGLSSSSYGHQVTYWKCLILFFATSKRFNKSEKHLLFTNVKVLPLIGEKNVESLLAGMDVEIVFTDFKYKTPKGYFNLFQNQFYEFSILEHIVKANGNPADNYLILDSDCIFLKPVNNLFDEIKESGFMSFEDDCTTELVIHGLSRRDMKKLYEELLEKEISEIPGYHLGEFLMASVKNINIIFADFLKLWPELLRRQRLNLPKFNEEAQTLSFLYYKNHLAANPKRNIMKRIWTNPVFYRNVEATDANLYIWHLPAEKRYGLDNLYDIFINKLKNFQTDFTDLEYWETVKVKLGIPYLSPLMKIRYYVISYYRAIKKRVKVLPGL